MNEPTFTPWLPEEVWAYTFGLLPKKDLKNTRLVCREWLAAHTTNEIWKCFCKKPPFSYEPVPFNGSWKERYRILCKWINQKPHFKTNSLDYWSCGDDVISRLVNNMHIQIMQEPDENLVTFSNFDKPNESISIRLDKKDASIQSTHLSDSKYIVLTDEGVLVAIDIVSGNLLQRLKIDPDLGSSKINYPRGRQVFCNDSCYFVYHRDNKEISIWDAEGLCTNRINLLDLNKSLNRNEKIKYNEIIKIVGATSEYIFLSRDKGFIRINFKDDPYKKNLSITYNEKDTLYINVSEKYYVIYSLYNSFVQVYKNDQDAKAILNLDHPFQIKPRLVKIFNEWLLVLEQEKIYVYDIPTKKCIFSKEIKTNNVYFHDLLTDGNRIIFRLEYSTFFTASLVKEDHIYDFRPIARPPTFVESLSRSFNSAISLAGRKFKKLFSE